MFSCLTKHTTIQTRITDGHPCLLLDHSNRTTSVRHFGFYGTIGHSDDLLQHILLATEDLDCAKALQVSMDGLSVNWASYKQLQKGET